MSEIWTGHVLVQRSPDEDAANLLGSEDWWTHFDSISVGMDIWNHLEQLHFWDMLNQGCSKLIDRYEEEWIETQYLSKMTDLVQEFLRRYDRAANQSADTGVKKFLNELLMLARFAQQRNVPLIFAF